jgi:recombination DNA repair RAD52 pathway protein
MSFTDQQIEQLLKPIHPSRVAKDPKGMSYIEQHDVRAHLTRVFGFGNWEHELTRLELVFEEPTKSLDKNTGKPKPDRWDVCYSASVRLLVKGYGPPFPNHSNYEDAATGFAQNQTRGEAHDLALKSAVSTALKRAATSLGDQFGLSLYAGTTNALVRGVLGWEPPEPEVEAEVEAPSNVTPLPRLVPPEQA